MLCHLTSHFPSAAICLDVARTHQHARTHPPATYTQGRESLFDNGVGSDVDPRSIAQRIMDIRTQLSEEFVQELQTVAEENAALLRCAGV